MFFVIINLDDVMMLHHAAGKQTKRRMTTTTDVIEMSNPISTGNVFVGVTRSWTMKITIIKIKIKN